MANDNEVEIHFSASTDDALAGIERIRQALSGLTAPVKALRQALAEQKILLGAEASQFQITQNQKFALLKAETQKEYQAELALLQQRAALAALTVGQRQAVLDRIAELEAKHRTDMLRLDEQAIAAQQRMWSSALGSIETAFNSQLRGLLAGTTTWSQAFKKILGDLVIQFIEACETMVVKWTAAQLAQTTAATSGAAARAAADASYQTYCKACGFNLSPALADQEQASSILQRWLQLTNTAAVWSGGMLKFIPYGDTATSAGANISTSTLHEIGQVPSGGSNPPPIVVANASYFVADGGVKYANSGVALRFIGGALPASAGSYGMSPGGTYLFAYGDQGTDVEISYTYEVAASFVPNVTPIYNLDDDDFKYDANEGPLQVTRSDPFQAYNVWRLEIAERDNAYNLTTVEARDQNMIELVEQATGASGMRIAPTVTAHEICDPDVALISGQLMLQRAVYIRNTYKFRLSWEYCLLDPMDLMTVTDSILGLNAAPVRITEIEEDENGFLQVTAEEFPLGVANATLYATQPVTNNPINRNAAADPVNAPIIFEPPAALIGGDPQVWMAVSGGSAGIADPDWGGCNVLLSLDGSSYGQIGTITAPARMGALSSPLATYAGTNPDSADTLAVNLAESAGTLQTASVADAAAGNTLCVVDAELMSFQTATLVSAGDYALTVLYRGLYGTAAAAHSTGAPFARLDSRIFQYDLPAQYVGNALYLKFQSFNVFGGGLEELSSCTAYTYTPLGTAFDHAVAAAMLVGGNLDFGPVTTPPDTDDDFGMPLTLAVQSDVDLGAA